MSWIIFGLGHPKLIKIIASPRDSFPPGFGHARISSLLMKTAFPEKNRIPIPYRISHLLKIACRRREKIEIWVIMGLTDFRSPFRKPHANFKIPKIFACGALLTPHQNLEIGRELFGKTNLISVFRNILRTRAFFPPGIATQLFLSISDGLM